MSSEPESYMAPPKPLDKGGIPVGTAASRGLASMLGLDPRAAALAILVDLMLFGGDAASLGLLVPFGAAVAAFLGFIVYRIQVTYGGDTHDAALVKALSISLLTAIPVPLTPVLAVPCGVVGLVRAVRRK